MKWIKLIAGLCVFIASTLGVSYAFTVLKSGDFWQLPVYAISFLGLFGGLLLASHSYVFDDND